MTPIDLRTSSDARARRPAESEKLPERMGSWELVRRAGIGSLAEIYQARPVGSPAGQAAYAVKRLRPEWREKPEAVALLRREAMVGRQVSHPHLVPILAAGTAQPPYYLVMPWLAGRTLADRLAACEGLDLPQALWIARQVAEALEALWSAGWMHGDVKPGNIHLSMQGHVTLLDLGFARRQQETGSAVDRCVLGTVGYLAPETIVSALRCDIRSDIYSLGVVLFEILAGRLPFTGQTLAELAAQHRQDRAPELRRLVAHLPAGVIRLVREMLCKEPLRRPQTPRELIDRLWALEISTFSERRG
jgi:serine/threonine-protein kinase